MNKKGTFLILIFTFIVIINSLYFTTTLFVLKDPNYDVMWVQALIEKKESLISQVQGKKIIVSAGSSGLLGVRTKDIDAALGIPTYNLSTHAGLGINFILEETKRVVNPGDIVVLPLEFTLLINELDNNLLSLRYYQLYEREKLNELINLETYKVLLQRDFFTSLDLILDSIYEDTRVTKNPSDASFLNDHGDATGAEGYNGFEPQPLPIPETVKENFALKRIKEFSVWCKENDVQLFLSYSGTQYLPEYETEKYKAYFDYLSDYFSQNDIQVLEKPEEVFFETELFYDTPYHLNETGMTIRTAQLIEKLKLVIEHTP